MTRILRIVAALLLLPAAVALAGDYYAPGDTVTLKFTTRQSTGAPYTLAGSPVISVYKNGSTTESTTGVTLSTDYDSRTGLNSVAIDTSADGTFYATGNDFSAVITTGTVNSVSVVGEVVGEFHLGNMPSNTRAWSGTNVATPDTAGYPKVTGKSGTGTGEWNLTSGVVDADAKKINSVSTSSVTTINANLGTTQPFNFTGTGSSAFAKVDVQYQPNIWYVATSGNGGSDSNNGKSWSTPFLTVATAISTGREGDLIRIGSGTFTITTELLPKSGMTFEGVDDVNTLLTNSDANEFVFNDNFGVINDVTIRRLRAVGSSSSTTAGGGVSINGARNWTLEDMQSTGGIDGLIVTDSDGLRLRRVFASSGWDGAYIAGRNFRIDDSKFSTSGTFSATDQDFCALMITGTDTESATSTRTTGFVSNSYAYATRSGTSAGAKNTVAVQVGGDVDMQGITAVATATNASYTGAVYALADNPRFSIRGRAKVLGGVLYSSSAGSGSVKDVFTGNSASLIAIDQVRYDSAKVPTNGSFLDNGLIRDAEITAAKLATDAITAAKIAADAIGSSELATDAVGAAELAADSIGASEIATDAIGAAEIASSAIAAGTEFTGSVTVGTNNDKTGYALSSSQTFNVTGNITGNVTGSVGSVTGNVGGNVVGSTASVSGAVGSVTGNVGGNVTGSIGSVATGGITAGSLAADAITAAKIANGAIGPTEIATDAIDADALSDDGTNAIATAVWVFGDSDRSLSVPVEVDTIKGQALGAKVGINFNQAFQNAGVNTTKIVDDFGGSGGGGTDWTTTEKNQIRYRLGLDGTTATPTATPNLATAAAIAALPSAVGIRTEMDANSTKLANLDATMSSRLATSGYTAPLTAAGTRTALGMASANLDTTLGTLAGYVDTEVAAIQAKTNNLPSDPADASDVAAAIAAVPTANQNRDALLGATLASFNGTGTFGQAVNWLKAAFTSSGILSTSALQNAPTGGDGGGGGEPADVDQIVQRVLAAKNFAPNPRLTWILRRVEGEDGYVGSNQVKRKKPGETLTFYADASPLLDDGESIVTDNLAVDDDVDETTIDGVDVLGSYVHFSVAGGETGDEPEVTIEFDTSDGDHVQATVPLLIGP